MIVYLVWVWVLFKIITKYALELGSLFLADIGQMKLKKVKNNSIYLQTTDCESTKSSHGIRFASAPALSTVM